MTLLFNMLSRFVIALLPRSICLLISWLQSPPAVILEPPKIVYHCFHCFPNYLLGSDGTRWHDLHVLNVEFKLVFSVSFFTFIKMFFSSSSFSAITLVSCEYLRLLIFLPAILIPAYASSSLAFCMMYSGYSGYKLNEQGDNTQHWRTLPNLESVYFSMSSSNCCFLTCT